MKNSSTLQMEVIRCFGSLQFLGCIILVILSCGLYLADSWKSVVQNANGVYSVVSIVNQMINFDRFKSLTILAAAFVFSGSICDDWKENYHHFICIRNSLKKYAFTKVLINGIGVFIAVSAGILIFSLFLSLFVPFYIPGEINLNEYGGFLGCFFYMILPFTFGCILLTTLGILFSTFEMDKMAVYAIPFLSNYVLSALTYNVGSDGMLFLSLLSSDIQEPGGEKFQNIFIKCFIFLILTGILSIVFYIKLKRRVENENYE